MKKYIVLLCFIITAKNYSQEFFVSYDISYKKDMEKSKESYKKVLESMANKTVPKEADISEEEMVKKREQFISMMLPMMPMMIDGMTSEKEVSIMLQDSLLIEKNTDINDSKSEKILKISELKEYYTEESKLISIREDIKDTKIIKGYKCHKVYLNVIEQPELPEMSFTIYEMYVTDEIKILYHPVIRLKSVLEKYFPMETIMHIQAYKGFEVKYGLKEIKI